MSASNERVNEKIVLKKLSEFKNRNKKVKHADESGIIHYNNWIEEKINHLK